MSLLKKNIAANFTGRLWHSLMALIFIPFYIKFLGIEAWGVIGIYATLLTTFGLMDMGLSSTLNREIARLSVLTGKEQEMCNLGRTLEVIYWGIASLVGLTVISLSPLIANQWVKAEHLPPADIEQALLIMGFVLALEMPNAFYSGGLMGLQRHVRLNVIKICVSTLRGGGAVLVLWLISPTIQAYFLWQIAVSLINNLSLALSFWGILPPSGRRPAFHPRLIKGIWRFAAGLSGITILAVILTQLDKIILSKLLTLEMFGYYTLASVVAMSLYSLISPIFLGLYPRLTQFVSMGDQARVKQLYHQGAQVMSAVILPVTAVIAVFSYDILLLWTRNPTTAQKAHTAASILICGTALNGLMHLPYALQLAFGWTRLGLKINAVLVAAFIPSVIILTRHYGTTGAAIVWLLLNTFYMAVGVPLTHRRLLKGEALNWFYHAFAALAPVLATVLAGRYFTQHLISPHAVFLSIVLIFFCALIAAGMSSEYIRNLMRLKLLKIT